MTLDQSIDELCQKIESMGLKGIVFKDGCFQAVPVEEPRMDAHRQMFHITIKEIPA